MNKAIIIAEAGVNHNGEIATARKLIEVASDANADIVKFQSFNAEELVSSTAPKANYQIASTGKNDGQLQMLKKLELPSHELQALAVFARFKNIVCLSTPFSENSASEIADFLPAWKVPSGEITNYPFLKKLAGYRKPIILSTGMSTLGEIEKAVKVITNSWGNDCPDSILINSKELKALSLLHCVSNYPAAFDSLNLRAIKTLKKAFGLPVGYSDHTLGIEASIAAITLGAEIIEKHFTLDRNQKGPDHLASIEPFELKRMIEAIRNIEMAMGTGIKMPHDSEENVKIAVRKSIHIKRGMKKGMTLSIDDFILKRPGNGISAEYLPILEGRKLHVDVKTDHLLNWSDVEN